MLATRERGPNVGFKRQARVRPSPLPGLALTLALVAALFGAAFVIGSATAGSDRGKVGEPRTLHATVEDVRVPALKKVEALPSLRGTAPRPDPGPDPDPDPGPDPPPPPPPRPNEPPIARLTVEPNKLFPGQVVLLDAGESSDPDDEIVGYEWDLDGDADYEIETDAPDYSTSYETAGRMTIGLKVTDSDGATAETRELVTVIADEQTPKSE